MTLVIFYSNNSKIKESCQKVLHLIRQKNLEIKQVCIDPDLQKFKTHFGHIKTIPAIINADSKKIIAQGNSCLSFLNQQQNILTGLGQMGEDASEKFQRANESSHISCPRNGDITKIQPSNFFLPSGGLLGQPVTSLQISGWEASGSNADQKLQDLMESRKRI